MSDDALKEPIFLGDCPFVVRNADDARRAAEWVEDELLRKLAEQEREAGGK